jgi:demethylmenaquinone methyltransferase/2-methoxy-6-polyprenyl-1,4-benzoquinol methylase
MKTVNNKNHDRFLAEQIEYYRARSNEYDEWFLRQGRYDHGLELNKSWFGEIETLRRAVNSFKPSGEILELACGTGIWTQFLVQYADEITAVDASPEVINVNKARTKSPKVQYIEADLFNWQPDKKYDVVFFAFWLSHVPPERFASFWSSVEKALKPQGRVFFIDSRFEQTSTARNHILENPRDTVIKRRLNDGREFNIVKVFYENKELEDKLRDAGWKIKVENTPQYFLYGYGGGIKTV